MTIHKYLQLNLHPISILLEHIYRTVQNNYLGVKSKEETHSFSNHFLHTIVYQPVRII